MNSKPITRQMSISQKRKILKKLFTNISQRLSKISNQKGESFVTTSHFHRSSLKLLLHSEALKSERTLDIDIQPSIGNLDLVFEEVEAPKSFPVPKVKPVRDLKHPRIHRKLRESEFQLPQKSLNQEKLKNLSNNLRMSSPTTWFISKIKVP